MSEYVDVPGYVDINMDFIFYIYAHKMCIYPHFIFESSQLTFSVLFIVKCQVCHQMSVKAQGATVFLDV